MNRRVSVGVAVALILIAVTITFTATMIFSMRHFDQKVLSVKEREAMYNKLSEIDSIVRQNLYFDIDEELLYDTIAKGYIDGLGDPDSQYLSQRQILQRNRQMEGTEVTVGFDTEKEVNGYMLVTRVYPNTSAEQLGLIERDIIKKVDGQDVLEIGYENAVALLRGTEGSKVAITYNRDSEDIDEELTRVAVEVESVLSTKLDALYYIRIRAFQNPTPAQFESAVTRALADAETEGLVIDLRGTDGGYNLEMVATMLDRLMPTGTIISGTYADGSTKVLYTSDEESVSLPIAVLVNQNTKGFAELFAGVLGDSDNCRIVGWTTYGKGTLQQLSMLSDGSALDLTVAILSTPVSGSYDEVGIKPDYEVEVAEGFTFSDSEPDALYDPVLKKAVEVITSIV